MFGLAGWLSLTKEAWQGNGCDSDGSPPRVPGTEVGVDQEEVGGEVGGGQHDVKHHHLHQHLHGCHLLHLTSLLGKSSFEHYSLFIWNE